MRDRRPRGERCGERSDGPLAWAGPAAAVSTAVAAAAHGGQVLLTGPARAAAGDALADSALADLGEHLFPGAPRPVRLWQALPRDLGARRFPPPRTPGARATNFPPERNLFIGREAELLELTGLIPTPAGRIVTLTGPGGIGKSRLALHAAARLLPRFPGGTWLVDLSEARTRRTSHATAHVWARRWPAAMSRTRHAPGSNTEACFSSSTGWRARSRPRRPRWA